MATHYRKDGAMEAMELRDYQFGVLIDLGNAAMRDPEHVSSALRGIADRIDSGEFTGTVRDENGNTVGSFHVEFWPVDDDDDEQD